MTAMQWMWILLTLAAAGAVTFLAGLAFGAYVERKRR